MPWYVLTIGKPHWVADVTCGPNFPRSSIALKEGLRDTDTIARLGGNEFAVILPNLSAGRAQAISKQILEIVQGYTVVIHGHPAGVTAGIGIAIFPGHGDTREALLACVNHAI